MRERQITNMRISTETIVRKVTEGQAGKTAFGCMTYGVLLDELVANDSISQEKAHKALWEGATTGRAQIVLAEVRKGNYHFPNTGAYEGEKTYGSELLEHVATKRISMKDALDAIREGRGNRIAYLLDQVEFGMHDMLNPADQTLEQELLRFARLGFVSENLAADPIDAGYRLRAREALEQVRHGDCNQTACSGMSYREELVHLVGLDYVEQGAAHEALLSGHRIVMSRRKQDALDITLAVREGRFAHPAGPYSDDTLTFGQKLKELVAERVVDEEAADTAFIEGRARIIEECARRSHHILDAVARGRSDLSSFSFLTFGEELQLLVEGGKVSREQAEAARCKGAVVREKRAESTWDAGLGNAADDSGYYGS